MSAILTTLDLVRGTPMLGDPTLNPEIANANFAEPAVSGTAPNKG